MATYTIDQYQRVWRQRARELRKAAAHSTQSAALFMRNTARGMAPMKTGALRQGIIAKPIKDAEWQVSSSVPKNFPYNLWVNRTAPYLRIHPWWNRFKPTVYGDGSHRNTGAPAFWTLATGHTVRVFGRIARANIRGIFKGLRVRLT